MINIHNNYVAIDIRAHVLRSCDLKIRKIITGSSNCGQYRLLGSCEWVWEFTDSVYACNKSFISQGGFGQYIDLLTK